MTLATTHCVKSVAHSRIGSPYFFNIKHFGKPLFSNFPGDSDDSSSDSDDSIDDANDLYSSESEPDSASASEVDEPIENPHFP